MLNISKSMCRRLHLTFWLLPRAQQSLSYPHPSEQNLIGLETPDFHLLLKHEAAAWACMEIV